MHVPCFAFPRSSVSDILGTRTCKLFTGTQKKRIAIPSVADPKLFIPDPDPGLNFLRSRSGSRQKFRIHADPDPHPTCNNKVSIIQNNTKTPLKFNQKEES